MKKTILYIITLIFMSCTYSQEGKQETKKAENPILIPIETPFNQLDVSSIDNVILEKGTSQKIEITKGQEFQNLLEINVVGNKLVISKKKSSNKQIYLKITYKELNQIKLVNIGGSSCLNAIITPKIIIDVQDLGQANLIFDCVNLKLHASHTADLNLTGQSKNSEIEVENIAELNASGLKNDQLKITAKNITGGVINVTENLDLELENCASFTVKGSPTIIKKEIKNVANFKM